MGLHVKCFSVFLSVLVLFTSLIHSAYAVDNGNEEGSTRLVKFLVHLLMM